MKNIVIQYYVEGEDEKQLINVLKTQLKMIRPGKVQKLNVVDKEITDAMIRAYKDKTIVVLVFDTDTGNVDILKRNIDKLKKCSSVVEVVTIPQVLNLEDELIRSCDIHKITELLDSRSITDFKRDFIRISNLGDKLIEHKFDINVFWNQSPKKPYQHVENLSKKIKQKI